MDNQLKLIFGVIGNATASALFLSPLPTFIQIFKKRSTGDFSGLPYVCTLFNCLVWVLYGMPFVKPHSVLILTVNGCGIVLAVSYIMIYLTYAVKDKKVQMTKRTSVIIIAYLVLALVVLLGLHSINTRQLAVGSMGVVVSIAMYASPLSVMGTVIRTRSVEYMPFFLSLFNFFNGAVWSAYSLVTKDIFIAIPNGLGTLSGIAQLVVYAIFKNAVPIAKEKPEKAAGTAGQVYLTQKAGLASDKVFCNGDAV